MRTRKFLLVLTMVLGFGLSVTAQDEKDLKDRHVFELVEQMPSFPGGNAALMSWLGENIKYPEIAENNAVEGRYIVRFVVGKDGRIGQVEIKQGREVKEKAEQMLREYYSTSQNKDDEHSQKIVAALKVAIEALGALESEAVRVVGSMPRWMPGKQNGETVNVWFTLPITFRLQ